MKYTTYTKSLNPQEFAFINKTTGEVEEFEKETKVYTSKLTGDVEYSSKNYSYLDNDKLIELLNKGIKYNELGVLITLSVQLMKRYNICMYNDSTPFTTKTLSDILKITPQATRNIIRRLIELNVLAQVTLKEMKHLGKVYIIDPQFIRKGKLFNGKLGQNFNNI
jgi:hypothetical protein